MPQHDPSTSRRGPQFGQFPSEAAGENHRQPVIRLELLDQLGSSGCECCHIVRSHQFARSPVRTDDIHAAGKHLIEGHFAIHGGMCEGHNFGIDIGTPHSRQFINPLNRGEG